MEERGNRAGFGRFCMEAEQIDRWAREGAVVWADRLGPAVLAAYRGALRGGLVTEAGRYSHGALYIRGQGLPVLSLPQPVPRAGERLYLAEGEDRVYFGAEAEKRAEGSACPMRPGGRAVTVDGRQICLSASVWDEQGAELAERLGIRTLGLFRTEGLARQGRMPGAAQQAALYRACRAAFPEGCRIRLADFNGDKDAFCAGPEEDVQTEALRMVSGPGLTVLLPNVRTPVELFALREKLPRSGEVGAMAETFAAFFLCDRLSLAADHMAVGFNWLGRQGCPRQALLRAVKLVLDNGALNGCSVSVCADGAEDEQLLDLCALGVEELTLPPSRIARAGELLSAARFSRLVEQRLTGRFLGVL